MTKYIFVSNCPMKNFQSCDSYASYTSIGKVSHRLAVLAYYISKCAQNALAIGRPLSLNHCILWYKVSVHVVRIVPMKYRCYISSIVGHLHGGSCSTLSTKALCRTNLQLQKGVGYPWRNDCNYYHSIFSRHRLHRTCTQNSMFSVTL